MGASIKAGGAIHRRRGGRRSTNAPLSEINVTPFVDVMLVLLIIFMVAAPLLQVGVPIELPDADGKQLEATSNKQPLAVSVQKSGDIYIGETKVPLDEIVPKLTAIAANGFDETIYVRGETDVDYGVVMRVMGRISAAGFKKISLVTGGEKEK